MEENKSQSLPVKWSKVPIDKWFLIEKKERLGNQLIVHLVGKEDGEKIKAVTPPSFGHSMEKNKKMLDVMRNTYLTCKGKKKIGILWHSSHL